MMNRERLRTKLNPILIISFLIVGVTGILMLLHVRSGGMDLIHQLLSIVFVITAILHSIVNWKIISVYLKRPATILALAVTLVISAGLIFMLPGHPEGPGRHGRGAPSISQDGTGNPQQD